MRLRRSCREEGEVRYDRGGAAEKEEIVRHKQHTVNVKGRKREKERGQEKQRPVLRERGREREPSGGRSNPKQHTYRTANSRSSSR